MKERVSVAPQIAAYVCIFISIIGGLTVSAQSIMLSRALNIQAVIVFRMGFGALLAYVAMRMLRIKWQSRFDRSLLSRSMTSAVASQAIYFSIIKLPIAMSTCLFHSTPVWTAVLGWFFVGIAIRSIAKAAIGVCILGVLLTTTPSGGGDFLGVAAGLIGAVLMSCLVLLTSKLRQVSAFQIIIQASLFSTATAAVLLIAQGDVLLSISKLMASRALIIALLITASVGAFSQLIVVYAMKVLDPTIVSTIKLVEIPLALLFGSLLFQTEYDFKSVLGAGLILVGSSLLAIYSLPLVPVRYVRRQIRTESQNLEQSVINVR
jgi:drug/metabolite transporter (DMT)-like permease